MAWKNSTHFNFSIFISDNTTTIKFTTSTNHC